MTYKPKGGPLNYAKHRAVKRIIEALEEHGPMTALELSKEAHIVKDAVILKLRRIRAGNLRGVFPHVRIAGWIPPTGSGPHVPRYGLGNEPDAPRVKIGRFAAANVARVHAVKRERKATRDQVVHYLATYGNATIKELCHYTGTTETPIRRWIDQLRLGVVPFARVRITGYVKEGRGAPSMRLGLGNNPDAKFVPMTRAEVRKKKRERDALLIGLKQQHARHGKVAGPFDQLLSLAK